MKFGVREEKEKSLLSRMAAAGLKEQDILEKFVRSGGSGGQRANKTSTCVYLKHVPSGLEVKVDRERTQALNRFLARRQLLELFESRVLGRRTAAHLEAEKRRKQKLRRARRSRSTAPTKPESS